MSDAAPGSDFWKRNGQRIGKLWQYHTLLKNAETGYPVFSAVLAEPFMDIVVTLERYAEVLETLEGEMRVPRDPLPEHQHRFIHLRTEEERLEYGFGGRVREWRIFDVFYCEGCTTYKRVHARTEEPSSQDLYARHVTWRKDDAGAV